MPKRTPRTRVVLLYNKHAGNGQRPLHDLEKLLRKHGYRPASHPLKPTLKRTDPIGCGEFMVVAGGDGSVRRVATTTRLPRLPIALLPTGTANNIATSLGIVGSDDDIIAGWGRGTLQPVDLGVAKGPWGSRRFIEGVGIGLLGRAISVLEEINDVSARDFACPEDRLYRDLCVLLALAREVPPLQIEVTCDGVTRPGRYLLFEILNINRAGPGVLLAPKADPSDGRLDIVSVTETEREKLRANLKSHLAELRRGAMLTSRRATSLRLAIEPGSIRIDDKVVWPRAGGARRSLGPITVDISVDPGAVDFLLPKSP